MSLREDIESDVSSILSQEWDIRDGVVVPDTTNVALAGGGVNLPATILYSDLADSTDLAMTIDRRVAAKVFKSFLAAATRCIRAHGGEVRSFDGDRVMGVFVGDYKNSSAAKAALKINWSVKNSIKPSLESKYESLRTSSWKLQHCTGIDTSDVLVVRGGIRNNNDLIWVGRSPNVAAKLSGIRDAPYFTFITAAVYDKLSDEAKISSNGKNMWEKRNWTTFPAVKDVYRSEWTWTP